MIALVLSMLLPVANAACPDPTSMSELTASVDDSMLSFATLDEEGFIESSDALLNNVPCLSEAIGAADAASIHRSLAMRAFWDGDDANATAYFRSARRLEPNHVLSNKIAPEGGPLATLYDGAERPTVRMTSFTAPSWTTVYVDGERASQRPQGVPALFQYEVGGEGIVWTGLVEAGADLPSLDDARAMRGGSPVTDSGAMTRTDPEPDVEDPVATLVVPDGNGGSTQIEDIDSSDAVANNSRTRPERTPREPREGGGSAKGPLIGATVATGVIAAGLFGVSAYSRSQFDSIPTEARYNLTNATFFGSVGAAAVTAGLLTATIAVK